jgi:hypothetical protein
MSTICGTRIIKNANQIRVIDPTIFAAKQPNEGFSSVIPIEILRQFHTMQPDQLQNFPLLGAVKQKILAQTAQQGVSPKGIIFSDPSFKGTVYLVKVTFRTKAATLSVSDADIAVVRQYLTMAAPAIAQYAAQYGENKLDVSSTILTMTVDVPSGKYDDDTLKKWLLSLFSLHKDLTPDKTCMIVLNPQGVVNTDGALSNQILGYHDAVGILNNPAVPTAGAEDSPYCFVNLTGTGLTLADGRDHFALGLSHEVAEMIADPNVSHTNPEICDGCAPNCNNDWRSYFSADVSGGITYLRSVKGLPGSATFPYDFFIAAVAQPAHVNDCPVSLTACSYAPSAKADIGELLFYERPTGYGTFWSESQDGNISLQTVNAFRQTWSLIVPGRYTAKASGGRLDLLFYSNSDSRGEFYQSGNLGDIHQLTIATGWRSTWANIVPGNFSGSGLSDLLFYEKSTGFGEFYRSDGKGNIALMSSFTNFRTTWSIILAGNFSNSPFDDLVFYDPTNGVVEFHKVDGKGGITLLKSYSSLRTTWSIILKGKFSDSPFDDLFFYDPVNGVGEFYTVDSSQQIRLLHSYSTLRKSWSIILKGKFSNSPYDGLLFYDPTNGVGEFYSNDGKGGMTLIRSHADWRKTWSIIQSL